MEEARRLDEERQARLAAAKAAKVVKSRREESDAGAGVGTEESGAVLPAGQRSARRTRSSNAADEVKKVDDVEGGGELEDPAAEARVERDEKMPG